MFAGLTVLAVKTQWQPFPRQGTGDIKAIGLSLLTTHSLVFELISIVLLMAIIGALVLARRGRS
jgi:NADH-quinone oxidoreductase subunit J